MIGGHLGSRVSALLDGQLPPADAERAWAHVHACHACRDLVEREGWIKTRLAGLSFDAGAAPDHLKGSLLGPALLPGAGTFVGTGPSEYAGYDARPRRPLGLVALGGGAVGAAVIGVVALGMAPADVPGDRRTPTTSLVRQTDAPLTPARTPAGTPTPVGPRLPTP